MSLIKVTLRCLGFLNPNHTKIKISDAPKVIKELNAFYTILASKNKGLKSWNIEVDRSIKRSYPVFTITYVSTRDKTNKELPSIKPIIMRIGINYIGYLPKVPSNMTTRITMESESQTTYRDLQKDKVDINDAIALLGRDNIDEWFILWKNYF